MPSPPTFFFSYAQGHNSKKAAKFFFDLEERAAIRSGKDPRKIRLGAFDQRLKQGPNWEPQLANALRTHDIFVALLSRLYIDQDPPNCGRELAAFIRRFPEPVIDNKGRLNVTNILVILWDDEEGLKPFLPLFLRNLQWKPACNEDDTLLANAIKRYLRYGMEGCVKPTRAYYESLLKAFADAMLQMPDLPDGNFEPDLQSGENAFTAEWLKPKASSPLNEETPIGDEAPVAEPNGPGDFVAIYVTEESLPVDARSGSRLIDENTLNAFPPLAAGAERISQLLRACRSAASSEGLKVFQYRCDAKTPSTQNELTEELANLTERNVLTALVVDPLLWPGLGPQPPHSGIDAIVRSTRWAGALFLPLYEDRYSSSILGRLNEWRRTKGAARRIAVLPRGRGAVIDELRAALVAERGRVMQTGLPGVEPINDPVPIPKGVGGSAG